ncbi:hypothetical protein [Chryseobacterium sp. 5_R23647]|uniref:hypothetical protein n=1 Tax=Chryseobacterium sp. 5_R23647 TaxID=2258964 RepID=UPI001E4BB525|nr:hypothetical protein [Chryseobacterium sp. 5_R23647]
MNSNRTGVSFLLSEKNASNELEESLEKGKVNESVFFKLKQLHGDQSIYLGQSILALIALNESPIYSDKINHSFKVELFASLIDELKITPEELRKELDSRLEWNQD